MSFFSTGITVPLARCLEKTNPKRQSWTTMKLFLTKDVRERAHARFGGEEGLQAERSEREKRKWASTLKKTKKVFSREK